MSEIIQYGTLATAAIITVWWFFRVDDRIRRLEQRLDTLELWIRNERSTTT